MKLCTYKNAFSVLTVILLAGCTQPLNSSKDNADTIAEALGDRSKLLESGIYRISAITEADGTTDGPMSQLFDSNSIERPGFSEFFAVQWHAGSKTYATSWGNVAFYDFDGRYHIMEWRSPETKGGSVYLPVEVVAGDITVLGYNCDSIPQNYRQAKALGDDCTVMESGTMLRAMGLMDFDGMDAYRFEIQSPISDLGKS